MFTHLKLKNFKSWKSAEVSFGRRITGLFGTNSSGKTSLLQFLLLLNQTMLTSDRNVALDLNGPFVELGTPSDVIFRHDKRRRLYYEIGMEMNREVVISDPAGSPTAELARSNKLTVEANTDLRGRAFKGEELTYWLGKAGFSLKQNPKEPSKFSLGSHGLGNFKFIRNRGRAWGLPGPVKSYQFPDQARIYYQNAGFLSDLESKFEHELVSFLYYLGPLREDPQRYYPGANFTPMHVGTRGEEAIRAILAAQEAKKTRTLKPRGKSRRRLPLSEIVAHWLKEMGLIHEFRLVEVGEGSNLWQVKVKQSINSSEVPLPDVGFGVSQVLPVIALLYYVPEGSTVVLEQPEIHLHPLAQAELADLIINVAAHRNIQIILESHSEHLLLRLQRRIAEGEIPSDDVKLFFCNASEDASNGASRLEELRLDPLGNIENWPPKFMGDAFTETAEAELVRIRRRKAVA